MKIAMLAFAALAAAPVRAESLSPEADACKASGLIALEQRAPLVKDELVGRDSAKAIDAGAATVGVPVGAVVIGGGYVEKGRNGKPQTLVRLIGEKGKVLMTLFSDA